MSKVVKKSKKVSESLYRIINLTRNNFPLRILRDGKEIHIDIRRQGRGLQVPPVIKHSELTSYVNTMVKQGFIKLERV